MVHACSPHGDTEMETLYYFIRTTLGGLIDLIETVTADGACGMGYALAYDLFKTADHLATLIEEHVLIAAPDYDDFVSDDMQEGDEE